MLPGLVPGPDIPGQLMIRHQFLPYLLADSPPNDPEAPDCVRPEIRVPLRHDEPPQEVTSKPRSLIAVSILPLVQLPGNAVLRQVFDDHGQP